MPTKTPFESHEQYFASVPPDVRAMLGRIQAMVESKVPQATRCISYNMPAFKSKKTFFYFAAFKKHIGVYPPVTADAVLIKELAPYRGEKGNLTFPLNKPIPYELIGRVAAALAKQYA
ncbi:MAG: iron chaperone [Burkholderiaceae bacterium]